MNAMTPPDEPAHPAPGTAPTALDPAAARAALARGEAVILPNAAPLTHVVAGIVPGAVNAAKGRPRAQAVALWAHHPRLRAELAPRLALDPGGWATAVRLLDRERITLLVPLAEGPTGPAGALPDWLAPATVDGWTLLFGAREPALAAVLDPFPRLYVSSANPTGRAPVASAAEALAAFPAGTRVLADHPELADPPAFPGPRRATTTLRLWPDGRLDHHRPGAQCAPHPTPAAYLATLRPPGA
ncbi:hypothetical protein ACN20G_24500 [Streptomyces sp. BI20]|uniref:hypothetical protein n=1 Tax=Streptomyces sp. BI20 TaxID=3403460 RepID=UPI003C70D184